MEPSVARYHIYYLRNCRRDDRGIHIVSSLDGIRELSQDIVSAGKLGGRALVRNLPTDVPRGGLLNVAPDSYRVFRVLQLSVKNHEDVEIAVEATGDLNLLITLNPAGYASMLEAMQDFEVEDDFCLGAKASEPLAKHVDPAARIWFWHQY